MATENSMLNASLDSSVHTRRNSLAASKQTILSENNDEAERLAYRHKLHGPTVSTNLLRKEKRHSLGLAFVAQMPAPQIAERITECIKLNAENKISVKNAFGLGIIDFMTYMIKKQDANMSNLQIASTSLDASTKIYGCRVDGVYMEILKMIAQMDKQEKGDENNGAQQEMDATHERENDDQTQHTKKKPKKRKQQRILNTIDHLKGIVETAKPSPVVLGQGDLQTTDALYQAVFPNHGNSGFYLHRYNDVIVDTIKHTKKQPMNMENAISEMKDFLQSEVSPPFSQFEFQNWMVDCELQEERNTIEPAKENESRFHFDLDASVQHDDEFIESGVNWFDINDEEDNVESCMTVPRTENIVDVQKALTSTVPAAKVSEYSFIQPNASSHWAGPLHWKANNVHKISANSRIVETCQQGPTRRKKEIELSYEEDTMLAVVPKFSVKKSTTVQATTVKNNWKGDKLILPRDVHYDIASVNKLYLHLLINAKCNNTNELNATNVCDSMADYSYDNVNDISNYCPNAANDDYGTNEENNEDHFKHGDPESSDTEPIFTGTSLVAAPKLTNKIAIAYSLRAKKVDMKQLKQSIWKSLISKDNKENVNIQEAVEQETRNKMIGDKCFSKIYKTLPSLLSKTNAEALSFPISFVSLLHLANEKTLNIQSLPDMSDMIVKAD